MGQGILELSVTQETVANHPCQSASTPVAMPCRYDLARCVLHLLHHAQLRRQYITRAPFLGTLMRHFFLLLALPIALLASGMGESAGAGALIAPASLALPYASGLIPALLTAIAPAPVTVRAHQDHAVAMHARKRSSTAELPTRHWRSPWSPRMRATSPTGPLDLIARRCNNLHALVADTVGRAS